MTPEDITAIRQSLAALKATLLLEKEAAQEGTAPVELDQARVGRLSRMDSMQQQAMAQELDRRRDTQLKRIEGASLRIDKGTYGQCAKCSKSIEAPRLDFDPTVFFCQHCAAKAEKR